MIFPHKYGYEPKPWDPRCPKIAGGCWFPQSYGNFIGFDPFPYYNLFLQWTKWSLIVPVVQLDVCPVKFFVDEARILSGAMTQLTGMSHQVFGSIRCSKTPCEPLGGHTIFKGHPIKSHGFIIMWINSKCHFRYTTVAYPIGSISRWVPVLLIWMGGETSSCTSYLQKNRSLQETLTFPTNPLTGSRMGNDEIWLRDCMF